MDRFETSGSAELSAPETMTRLSHHTDRPVTTTRRRFLVAAAGTLLAGCTAREDTPEHRGGTNQNETSTPTDGDGGRRTISMVSGGGSYYFDPIGLFIEPGETVTWTIQSGSHSTTAYVEGKQLGEVTRIPTDASFWNSGVLSGQGTTYEHTFETPGTYDYYCIPHKSLGMVGRIVVGEPGGPAEGSMPPDGSVPSSGTIVDQGAVSYSEFSG